MLTKYRKYLFPISWRSCVPVSGYKVPYNLIDLPVGISYSAIVSDIAIYSVAYGMLCSIVRGRAIFERRLVTMRDMGRCSERCSIVFDTIVQSRDILCNILRDIVQLYAPICDLSI